MCAKRPEGSTHRQEPSTLLAWCMAGGGRMLSTAAISLHSSSGFDGGRSVTSLDGAPPSIAILLPADADLNQRSSFA